MVVDSPGMILAGSADMRDLIGAEPRWQPEHESPGNPFALAHACVCTVSPATQRASDKITVRLNTKG
jgi:hypothetical protein